jgi:hypothetical protein
LAWAVVLTLHEEAGDIGRAFLPDPVHSGTSTVSMSSADRRVHVDR